MTTCDMSGCTREAKWSGRCEECYRATYGKDAVDELTRLGQEMGGYDDFCIVCNDGHALDLYDYPACAACGRTAQ